MNMDFKSAKELLDLCEENQLPISEVMRQRECILGEGPRDAVDHRCLLYTSDAADEL